MEQLKNNIPAFPVDANTVSADLTHYSDMTLLDYFAAHHSKRSIITRPSSIKQWFRWALGKSYKGSAGDHKDVARNAYLYAAAMLEERRQYIE